MQFVKIGLAVKITLTNSCIANNRLKTTNIERTATDNK
ncbi:Uncharacterised protein [Sphingobacterium multivorum]|uniref:Uncharacterized protein n=1 Tax=Sphingobacterium multivorum TaxID=28454 RepID=A0A2X2L6K8_SPHMU|nr:Uncharacterised protein [Sphingobacterium multivorum]